MKTEFHSHNGKIALYLADALKKLPELAGQYQHIISDPPFSARTHKGQRVGPCRDASIRRDIQYTAWSEKELCIVADCLPAKGWACFLTDHTLAREWEIQLQRVGRYVFAPIPLVVPGRTCRLTGDGPSSWTDWLVVSRTKHEVRWGTLRGAYLDSPGSILHVGGKPINAMCEIVSDYSRAEDTVCDPCLGMGTTAIACIRMGRRFVGVEIDPETFANAVKRIEKELARPRLLTNAMEIRRGCLEAKKVSVAPGFGK